VRTLRYAARHSAARKCGAKPADFRVVIVRSSEARGFPRRDRALERIRGFRVAIAPLSESTDFALLSPRFHSKLSIPRRAHTIVSPCVKWTRRKARTSSTYTS
jgi:hypothetical protein